MKRAHRLLPQSPSLLLHTSSPRSRPPPPVAAGRRALSLLQHHHLKPAHSSSPPFVHYDFAAAVQEEHRARFLAWKAAGDSSPAPRPQLLSFQALPTYTLGRRQPAPSPAAAARLARPLTVDHAKSRYQYTPSVRQTSRGGLTTYHGPGQLVLWPVLDMRSARLGVSSYARLLEDATRALLAARFALDTYTNPEEPGVWVAGGRERKIAALGVHHRRHVTALGVALNVHVPVAGDDEGVNPWARFVPCGLEGKLVTSVAAETGREGREWREAWATDMEGLAEEWAARFEEGLLKG
ncbi:Octanoyltransferase [Cordyceps fumosorosea ARSEF 2679]|uniref:lipoyl(octanoyl) transferase n=1 Tax=Cordyceps fumosorosea (strain ARSEF 2679) TaxID=1081104 RepID=A0A162IDN2_CORFA|nr:Octanoyltransferase [Cordyceps fumosorosea ARSEF 2679]OAA55665.1 Octanoyltransferase [Cordyceps fumosorosea ARSEF 2679]